MLQAAKMNRVRRRETEQTERRSPARHRSPDRRTATSKALIVAARTEPDRSRARSNKQWRRSSHCNLKQAFGPPHAKDCAPSGKPEIEKGEERSPQAVTDP